MKAATITGPTRDTEGLRHGFGFKAVTSGDHDSAWYFVKFEIVTGSLVSFTLKRESSGNSPMTLTIELPDEQAAALKAKAATQGLTLEA